MGKMKENPRYNVISVRVTDEELKDINEARGIECKSQFILAAITEKIERIENAAYTPC